MRKTFFYPVLLFTMLLSLGSCINDDLTECIQGLRLQFSYTLNMQYKDLLKDSVTSVHAYIFDQNTEVLVATVPINAAGIARGYTDVDLPAGYYTISAFGSDGACVLEGGYAESSMTNLVTGEYTNAVIGKTTLEDFRMVLQTEPMTGGLGAPGEVIPVMNGRFDDLFFGMVRNVEVEDKKVQTVKIDLIKDTSILHVKVTGLQYFYNRILEENPGLSAQEMDSRWPPMICAGGNGERYNFDNSIDPYTREVCYNPPYRTLTTNEMTLDIKVQHLDIARFDRDEPVHLHIRDIATGEEILQLDQPLDIINDIITKAKDKNGNLRWPDQEAIDRENEFPIEISILSDLSVNVTVDGFEVIDTEADISRP